MEIAILALLFCAYALVDLKKKYDLKSSQIQKANELDIEKTVATFTKGELIVLRSKK
jgi:hypothetical protein